MAFIQSLGDSVANLSCKAITTLSTLSVNEHHNAESEGNRATTYKYNDEIERLEIWIGDHEVRCGRLDIRLREASPLRERVLLLLAELSSIIHVIPPAGKSKSD